MAGLAGVAASGAVVARAERRRRAYTPDEVRARLQERAAAAQRRGRPEDGATTGSACRAPEPDDRKVARGSAKCGAAGTAVGVVGLGCWQLGADWGEVDEADALAVLHAAADEGVTFFDTADVYGDGRSEGWSAGSCGSAATPG